MTSNNSNQSLLIVGAKVRVKRDNRLFETEYEGQVGEVTGRERGFVDVRFENGGTDYGYPDDVEVIGLPEGTRVHLEVAGGAWLPRFEGMTGVVRMRGRGMVFVRFDNGITDYGPARYLEVVPEARKPAFERLSVGDRIRVISAWHRFMSSQIGKTGIVGRVHGIGGSRGRVVEVRFDDGSTDDGLEAECEKLAPITVSSNTATAAGSLVKVSRITAARGMKQADRPLTVAQIYWKGRHKLTPLARSIYALIDGMGSITALDAMRAKGVSSGSLTRRITELRDIGLPVVRETHKDPLTGRRYGKWRFAGTSK